jgi:hypothetical protein
MPLDLLPVLVPALAACLPSAWRAVLLPGLLAALLPSLLVGLLPVSRLAGARVLSASLRVLLASLFERDSVLRDAVLRSAVLRDDVLRGEARLVPDGVR